VNPILEIQGKYQYWRMETWLIRREMRPQKGRFGGVLHWYQTILGIWGKNLIKIYFWTNIFLMMWWRCSFPALSAVYVTWKYSINWNEAPKFGSFKITRSFFGLIYLLLNLQFCLVCVKIKITSERRDKGTHSNMIQFLNQ